jgi:hypothetical protein
MDRALEDVEKAFRILDIDPWSDDVKISERVLPAIFSNYYKNLGLRNEMRKADFHSLVEYNVQSQIDPEITEVLDELVAALRSAKPGWTE